MNKNISANSSLLEQILLKVDKPGRYTGGEYGAVVKPESDLKTLISFPDMYEIGMSNVALRLMYNLINRLEGISCERVFAPAEDLARALSEAGQPLFSLETWSPLKDFDIIGFTLGYELAYTPILNILELGHIPRKRAHRGDDHPIVIIGGPGVTNPLPLSLFADFIFVGEGEPFFLETYPRLKELKKAGAPRSALVEVIAEHPSIWFPEKNQVRRSVWQEFTHTTAFTGLPVPNIKVVQDQGTVEIMRGCPNGCRYCHAGIVYRPFRMKKAEVIKKEVEHQVFGSGYREVTLGSLSTGDYRGIERLVPALNKRFKNRGISFSLPSLKVNTLSLELLEEVSAVRKSGLTFAIESPGQRAQLGMNKEVSQEKVIELLEKARQRGWRVAKFYFMLGMPISPEQEGEEIAEYLKVIYDNVKINLNVTLSTFIPKPHTPFQWARQLTEEESKKIIFTIKDSLRGRKIKISYHSPFASQLEGLISRGDERTGEVIDRAYEKGARLDAWEEHLSYDTWRQAIAETHPGLLEETLASRDMEAALPWDFVDVGVKKSYLKKEWDKSRQSLLTPACDDPCREHCGICGKNEKVNVDPSLETLEEEAFDSPPSYTSDSPYEKLLIAFTKTGKARFLSHLNIMTIMGRSLLRAGYDPRFTMGFNPKPRIELANPLSLGMIGEGEVCTLEVHNFDDPESFSRRMNEALPEGFSVCRIKVLRPYVQGTKKLSLASVFRGASFRVTYPNVNKIDEVYNNLNNLSRNKFNRIIEVVKKDTFTLQIEWTKVDKKGHGLLNILEEAGGMMEEGWTVVREHLRAGITPEDRKDYFEVMA